MSFQKNSGKAIWLDMWGELQLELQLQAAARLDGRQEVKIYRTNNKEIQP